MGFTGFRSLLILFAMGLASWGARADDLTFILLNHRDAASVIPMLRSMYGAKATISGLGNKLIIDGPADVTAEIRTIVTSLDGKPRLLRVAIRSPNQAGSTSTQLAGQLHVAAGPVAAGAGSSRGIASGGGTVSVGGAGAGAALQASQSQVTQNSMTERDVIVEEGVPATITDASGNQMVVKVVGDTTSLQMLPPTPSAAVPVTNASGLSTTVRAPNGQWVSIGGTGQSADGTSSGVLSHASSASQSSGQTMLQVTPVSGAN